METFTIEAVAGDMGPNGISVKATKRDVDVKHFDLVNEYITATKKYVEWCLEFATADRKNMTQDELDTLNNKSIKEVTDHYALFNKMIAAGAFECKWDDRSTWEITGVN